MNLHLMSRKTLLNPTTLALAALASAALLQVGHAATVSYYRFEDGVAGGFVSSVSDSSGHGNSGTVLTGHPTYTSAIPVNTIPQTGASNNLGLALSSSDAAAFAYQFPFQILTNATMEFWADPQSTANASLLWGTNSNTGDKNRFSAGFFGGHFYLDYRDSNGSFHQLGSSTGTIPTNQWTFIAVTKQGNNYSIYINGSLNSSVTDFTPNLPTSAGWTLNGRVVQQPTNCCQYSGLLDEVRLSDVVLSPSQFLASPVPELPTQQLLLVGVAGVLAQRFKMYRRSTVGATDA